ncbi:UDP-glycosyltransferase 90A1-like protein [Tanacetum coccineum]|uniref:UDP-glycosyltransferase 90A1-like protein n=1 Tax=Tanacetum coccineum TaxID=301880 RepID=A0ABQ4ZEV5_9ASTR
MSSSFLFFKPVESYRMSNPYPLKYFRHSLVIRRRDEEVHPNPLFEDGFEERVKEKGIVVQEWVNQRDILEHEIVKGFVSHCGWNSVLESICAGKVKCEGLEKKVKELMEGEKGKEVRKKVAELRNSAMKEVEEGGLPWRCLNELIDELQNK